MALYIGNQKVKINFGATKENALNTIFKLFAGEPMFVGVKLLSSDNFVLKSSDGKYITAKKEAN